MAIDNALAALDPLSGSLGDSVAMTSSDVNPGLSAMAAIDRALAALGPLSGSLGDSVAVPSSPVNPDASALEKVDEKYRMALALDQAVIDFNADVARAKQAVRGAADSLKEKMTGRWSQWESFQGTWEELALHIREHKDIQRMEEDLMKIICTLPTHLENTLNQLEGNEKV